MPARTVAHSALRLSRLLTKCAGSVLSARLGHRAGCGLLAIALLASNNIALAAGPTISSIRFTGSNADLTVTISGNGFGLAPPGVPCKSCANPYLQISGYDGCSDVYNINSWDDSRITLTGVQQNSGNNIIFAITNPQNHMIGVQGVTVPTGIAVRLPQIKSVTFNGSGRNLRMTVTGSGFGAAPIRLPNEGDVRFFGFTDQPFASTRWQAGFANCGTNDTVGLNYVSWSDTKISISGFGSEYGRGPAASNHWTVAPGDIVAIFVGNSATLGLTINYSDVQQNYYDFYHLASPAGAAAVWGGVLP
jgi:hypothetical protein